MGNALRLVCSCYRYSNTVSDDNWDAYAHFVSDSYTDTDSDTDTDSCSDFHANWDWDWNWDSD